LWPVLGRTLSLFKELRCYIIINQFTLES
jgi:hypothetical protein